MEELDPRAPALDLATEVVDATFEVHMGGGLLPAAAWRSRGGAAPRPSLVVTRTTNEEVVYELRQATLVKDLGAAGAGGQGGQAPLVAGAA